MPRPPARFRRPIQLTDKIAAAAEPQAFVCVGETCSLPVSDPGGLNAAIEAVRHS